MQSSTVPKDVERTRSATAQSSRPSTPEPEMPSSATEAQLNTAPHGERKSPNSHRRNRHAPVLGSVFGPMVSTPHGVMPLLPLVTKQGPRAPGVPRGRVGQLSTIGEVGAEAESEELRKEAEKEKEEYGVRKIRFEDYHSKSENHEKK